VAELADTIRPARLFIGADSGPTHLAAQLGVRTLGLFGPTDPGEWAPVGPRVRVLARAGMGDMAWLDATEAAAAARAMLGAERLD
jgi:ADP-heptose:LPS heptosyltransferase